MPRKGIAPIYIAIIVAVIIFAVGGGYALKMQNGNSKQKNVDLPREEKTVDISNWKTYRNEKYGFQFDYPKEWVDDPRTHFKSA